MSYIPRAQLGRGNRHLYLSVALYRPETVIGFFERLSEHGGHLARDAQNALAVGAVGGDAYVEDVVVQPEQRLYVLAVPAGGGQYEQTVVVCAFEHVAAHAQLGARTEHALGEHSAQLALLYGHHALYRNVVLCGGVDCRALERHGRLYALFNIVCAAAYLKHAPVAAINFAHMQVRALYRFAFRDFADAYAGDVPADVYEFFHFEPAGKELFFQLLRAHVYIHIVFKPA